jgi:hypothetical protein
MPIYQAEFEVVCTPTPTVALSVNYATVDESATAYADYILAAGTLVFQIGETSKTIKVNIRHPITDLKLKTFHVVLSNPVNARVGQATSECRISGPPSYAAVPFPGPRVCLIGDSITYANTGYNPLGPSDNDTTVPSVLRNSYFSTGMTGFFIWANALLGHPFELETALQPNTNPGAYSHEPHTGYDFGVYSSQTQQWLESQFDPIPESPTSVNIGPMLNALNYLSKWDIAIMMGGTNDLSAGVSPATVLLNLMNYAYTLAEAGKWVFIMTITPRTGDLLGGTGANQGYSIAEQATIMLNIQQVNQGLRDWIASAAPSNIFLVDSYAKMLGPNASLVAGNPTDPFGLTSATVATMGTTTSGQPQYITNSTPGNYRSDTPGVRACYDGLHPAPAGGYILGNDLANAFRSACGLALPAPATLMVGPLTIGPNLMVNGSNAFADANVASPTSPQPSRVPPAGLKLGRAIGLGAPLTDGSHPPSAGSDVPAAGDAYANHGLGYTHGPVPNYFFIYRESNNDNESYSNFNNYTFSQFVGGLPALAPFMVDSTWSDGCLTTRMVTATINGVSTPGLELTFQAPAGLTHNEGFTVRYDLSESQNNAWNNYGYEGTSTQRSNPTPPYSPGDVVAADGILLMSGVGGGVISPNMMTCRLAANFICYDPNNGNTSSAVVSGLSMSESYYPFDNVAVVHQHPATKQFTQRTMAVYAPTPVAGEIQVKCQLDWQFAFDCSTVPASATITIFAPRVAKITGPAL